MLGMGAFNRPDTPYAENGLKDLNARFAGASILCVPILRLLLLLMGVREVAAEPCAGCLPPTTQSPSSLRDLGDGHAVPRRRLSLPGSQPAYAFCPSSTCARARRGGGGPVLNPQVSRTVVFRRGVFTLSVVVSHAEISRLRALGDGVRPALPCYSFGENQVSTACGLQLAATRTLVPSLLSLSERSCFALYLLRSPCAAI